MSSNLLETSLASASKKLDEISARRERLIKESRDIISLSSKAIVSVHTSDLAAAKTFCAQARKQLGTLRRVAGADLTRYILVPEQEYVECSVILLVTERKKIPSMKNLGVTTASYILGLLDAVGELKRAVYDRIRQDDLASAEIMFSTMEMLYTMVSPFAVYDNIVQGVRRKLDVARMLIEDTRATVTEEVRRAEFVSAVNELSSRLGTSPLLEKGMKHKGAATKNESIASTDAQIDADEDTQ